MKKTKLIYSILIFVLFVFAKNSFCQIEYKINSNIDSIIDSILIAHDKINYYCTIDNDDLIFEIELAPLYDADSLTKWLVAETNRFLLVGENNKIPVLTKCDYPLVLYKKESMNNKVEHKIENIHFGNKDYMLLKFTYSGKFLGISLYQ